MKSFELPEFYMPYQARCNPHRESARIHATAWAIQMGMLDSSPQGHGSVIWNERDFESADFPLYAALAYPDASSPELDLLTDWHVWSWFLNDFFSTTFIRLNDLTGGMDYISRLATYMPLGTTDIPEPTNPVESGLADLWVRTVSASSVDWRARLHKVLQSYLQNTTWKIFNSGQDWVPNPINYIIDIRRKAGGMELVACLVEHSLGVEIPAELDLTRPLVVLKDTFADESDLRNDIFSYQKESRAGELNGVMITEQFLDCDLQRAVDVVNELVTSRMQQFENTALVELHLLFEDYRLDPKMRLDILRYVKALEDCMAGDLEWHRRTSRYATADSPAARRRLGGPTGIGTVAARLGLTRRVAAVAWPTISPTGGDAGVSRVELPEFYMPFKARCNPHEESARAQSQAWAAEMGMLGSGLPDWDEAGFDAGEYARLAALAYPDVPSRQLEMAAMWWTWLTFFADSSDELFQRRRDLAGAKAAFDRLSTFMPISLTETAPIPTGPLERGLADLWSRTAPAMSEDWRCWLSGAIMNACEGFLWEILNFIENRIADPVDYVEMRRQTTGAKIFRSLTYYVIDSEVPSEIHNSRPMHSLVESFCDWWGFTNDIFSYQREMEREGEIHNGVLVIQRFLDCDAQQAVTVANDLATSQLRHFEHLAATELPDLVTELDLGAADCEHVDRYVHSLQNFIGGFFQAHVVLASSRYGLDIPTADTEPGDTPAEPTGRRPLGGPTGLGTAAARIGTRRTADVPAPVAAATESPSPGRLTLGPTGLGTAATRMRPIRDADDGLELASATTRAPDAVGGGSGLESVPGT